MRRTDYLSRYLANLVRCARSSSRAPEPPSHGATTHAELPLARKPNYGFEKRQKEQERKNRKEEKAQRRRERAEQREQEPTAEPGTTEPGPPSSAD